MPSPLLARLRTTLLRSLIRSSARTDTFLLHTQRLLSTTSGVEATLCTLYYTLALVHSQLTNLLSKKYERLAETIAQNASKTMLPGETLIASIEPPHLTLTQICAGTKALGDAVEDVRLFMRLWNLISIYTWARDIARKQTRDPAIKVLLWGRVAAQAGWQVCENLAYLVRRGVLRGKKWEGREDKLWIWSARFWLAETTFSLLRLWRVRQLRYNEEFGAEKVGEDEAINVKSQELEERWWRDLYSTLAWVPGSLHFGFFDEELSPVSEGMIGMSGIVPGVIALREAWKKTA